MSFCLTAKRRNQTEWIFINIVQCIHFYLEEICSFPRTDFFSLKENCVTPEIFSSVKFYLHLSSTYSVEQASWSFYCTTPCNIIFAY